eukprot:3447975-Alexandrium_andersonii.AAC.1
MSASLVGSEMCIRDRTSRLGVEECWRGQQKSSWAGWWGPPESGGAPLLTCLLYTSDAADDM